jgi:predicted metal-binding membrane protein
LTAEVDRALAAVLRRDRFVVVAALIAVTAIAWAYILVLARRMSSGTMPPMSGMEMMAPAFSSWTIAHAIFIFTMWAVMMIGMMTPSASPMILIYTQVARQANTLGKPFASAFYFTGGYLLAWTGFAAVAVAAQFALERAALLSPIMITSSKWVGGGLLIAVGLYQWSPVKDACLTVCRAPLSFVQAYGGFQSTELGSLRLGLLHGLYCIGCCWALMVLLFVGGIMNLLWIAVLMLLVLAEKVLPGGRYLGRMAGLVALVAGGATMAG